MACNIEHFDMCDLDYTSPRTTYITGTDYQPPAPTDARTAQFDISRVMASMGWTDGSFIPIATEANQALMLQMQALTERKEQAQARLTCLKHRVHVMQERHQHTVEQTAQHTKLQDAHRKQLADEHHLFKMSEHADAALGRRHGELLRDVADVQRHDDFTRGQIAHTAAAIAKHSDQMQWSRDALAEFDAAMRHGHDTNELIARYCKLDSAQANALELRRQQLRSDIQQRSNELLAANNEQTTSEKVLDRTAQLYREAHKERRKLVDTWKEAVQSLGQRERDIAARRLELEALRASHRRRLDKLREEEEFLLQVRLSNREAELDLDDLNARLAQTRDRLTRQLDVNQLLHTDSITQQKLVQSMQAHLAQQRLKNREAQRHHTEQLDAQQRIERAVHAQRDKYAKFVQQNLSAQQRLRHLEELVDAEEKQFLELAGELERLSARLYRAQHQVAEWNGEHKLFTLQHASMERDIRDECAAQARLAKELSTQIFNEYEVEYKIHVYGTRLGRMSGTVAVADPSLLTRCNELSAQCEAKTHQFHMVQRQVSGIEEEIRRLTMRQQAASAEMQRLQVKLEKERMEVEGGVKEVQRTTTDNHELLIEQAVLKLRVHQMDEAQRQQRDKVFNLQRHRHDLELAMNERLVEIGVRREQQQQVMKHLNEELTQLKADVGERGVKIAAVRARFENVVARLGQNEDGTTVSAAQIRVEMAQEKQLLLADGNQLNERVLQAERDIKAIEHTLLMVNYANDAYRKMLEPVKEDNKEALALAESTDALDAVESELKFQRQQLAERCKIRQAAEDQQQLCQQTLDDINRRRQQNNDTLLRLHRELLDQHPKLERARRELKLARRTAANKLPADERTAALLDSVELQLRARELADGNASAMQQLGDMVEVFAAMATVVAQQLWQHGLTMPMRTVSFQRLCKEDTRSELSVGVGSVSTSSLSGDNGGGGGGDAASTGRTSSRSQLSLGNMASCEGSPMMAASPHVRSDSPSLRTVRTSIVKLEFDSAVVGGGGGGNEQPTAATHSRTSRGGGNGSTMRRLK